MSLKTILWIMLITVWTANINDLIRGEWFYQSVEAVIYWNFMGIVALLCIVFYDKLVEKDEEEDEG